MLIGWVVCSLADGCVLIGWVVRAGQLQLDACRIHVGAQHLPQALQRLWRSSAANQTSRGRRRSALATALAAAGQQGPPNGAFPHSAVAEKPHKVYSASQPHSCILQPNDQPACDSSYGKGKYFPKIGSWSFWRSGCTDSEAGATLANSPTINGPCGFYYQSVEGVSAWQLSDTLLALHVVRTLLPLLLPSDLILLCLYADLTLLCFICCSFHAAPSAV